MKKMFLTLTLVLGAFVIANAQTSTSASGDDKNTTIQGTSNSVKPEVVTDGVTVSGCGMKSSSASGCCSSKKEAKTEANAKSCCKSGESKKSGCSGKDHGSNDESRKEKD
jgi:hypothetical protein